RLKGQKYFSIAISALLVMGFILMQPIQISGFDPTPDCVTDDPLPTDCIVNLEDGIAMNTVRSGKFVLTVHAEKEVFHSVGDVSDPTDNRITDVTVIGMIYENLNKLPGDPVISKQAHVLQCEKKENTAQLLGCFGFQLGENRRAIIDVDECVDPAKEQVFAPHSDSEVLPLTHPQEMNTITRGNIAKTIEAQKEIFVCEVDLESESLVGSFIKEVVIFTEIYEDLSTQSMIGEPRFIAMTCLKFAFGVSPLTCVFDEVLN
ncbi:MAG: hypothetical protein ACRD5H_07465, partial [Nitrososphaerales archaeon]